MCAKGSSPRIAAMSFCSCAAVGSFGCGSCVTRSLASALRRMFASGRGIVFFASAAGCVRFCSVQRWSRGAQVYGTLPDAAFCNASQPTKLSRALGGDDQHAQADTSPRFRKTPYAPALVRSTARSRSPQRKGRCIRVKPACKMTRGPPRLHSPAFSRLRGVNRDTRRPLRTRRNAHLRAARQE